jgi:hypothetical protein
MSGSQESVPIDQVTRVLQIIISALVTGMVVFLAIVLFLRVGSTAKVLVGGQPPAAVPAAPAQELALPIITLVALVFAAIDVPLSIFVPKLIADTACKALAAAKGPEGPPSTAEDVAALVSAYQTKTIAGAALNEGAGFLALIAYMLEGQLIALAVAVALIVGVALRFPRRAAVEQWVDDRLARVQLDRQSARFS